LKLNPNGDNIFLFIVMVKPIIPFYLIYVQKKGRKAPLKSVPIGILFITTGC